MLQFGPRRSLLSHANEPLVFEVQLLKVLWFPSIRWLFQKLLTTPKLHDQHRRGLLVLSDPFAEEVGVIMGVVRGSSLVFSKKIVKLVSHSLQLVAFLNNELSQKFTTILIKSLLALIRSAVCSYFFAVIYEETNHRKENMQGNAKTHSNCKDLKVSQKNT